MRFIDIIILHFAVYVNTFLKIFYNIFKVIHKGELINLYPAVRALREDNDMTQKQVAAYLHCSQQVYSNYELGQRDIPTDVLISLSSLYNVSVDFLLGLTENPKRNI